MCSPRTLRRESALRHFEYESCFSSRLRRALHPALRINNVVNPPPRNSRHRSAHNKISNLASAPNPRTPATSRDLLPPVIVAQVNPIRFPLGQYLKLLPVCERQIPALR